MSIEKKFMVLETYCVNNTINLRDFEDCMKELSRMFAIDVTENELDKMIKNIDYNVCKMCGKGTKNKLCDFCELETKKYEIEKTKKGTDIPDYLINLFISHNIVMNRLEDAVSTAYKKTNYDDDTREQGIKIANTFDRLYRLTLLSVSKPEKASSMQLNRIRDYINKLQLIKVYEPITENTSLLNEIRMVFTGADQDEYNFHQEILDTYINSLEEIYSYIQKKAKY